MPLERDKTLKYAYKLKRTHGLDEKLDKEAFMAGVPTRWESKARRYFEEWDKVVQRFGDRIPKLDRVKYRAMVFRAIKAVHEMNGDVRAVVDHFVTLGVDRALAMEILAFLGLIEASEARATP